MDWPVIFFTGLVLGLFFGWMLGYVMYAEGR